MPNLARNGSPRAALFVLAAIILLALASVVGLAQASKNKVSAEFTYPQPTVLAWIGLKTSDDVGTSFDLKAVVSDGSTTRSGTIENFPGGASGFNRAHEATIPVSTYVGSSAQISVTLYARVSCSSRHVSGTARLWWNDAQANSRVGASVFGIRYLNGLNGLSLSPGPGPKMTSDVVVKKNGCPNQPDTTWKPFGTWTGS